MSDKQIPLKEIKTNHQFLYNHGYPFTKLTELVPVKSKKTGTIPVLNSSGVLIYLDENIQVTPYEKPKELPPQTVQKTKPGQQFTIKNVLTRVKDQNNYSLGFFHNPMAQQNLNLVQCLDENFNIVSIDESLQVEIIQQPKEENQ